MNERNIFSIIDKLLYGEKSTVQADESILNYDSILVQQWFSWEMITLSYNPSIKSKIQKRDGGFFKYLVSEKIYMNEWKRYGLQSKIDPKNYNHNCLYEALKYSENLTEVELLGIKSSFATREIPLTLIKKVATSLNTNIIVTYYKRNGKSERVETYKKGERKIKE